MKAKPIQVFRLFMGISTLAMLAALLTIFPTSAAAQSGGSSPSKAFPLAGEVNQGSLEPLEQHWYRFTPQGTDIEQTLYLVIAPDDGTRIKFVPLTVFEDSQIRFFSQDDTANMAVFGLGQLVALDGDRNTGERFWSGVVSEPTTYYIQIQNNSDFPIDYRLFNSTVIPEEPDELEIPEVPAEPEPTGQAALASSAATSNDPGLAEALAFDESGLTQGKIAPNSVFWYSFGYPPSGESNFNVCAATNSMAISFERFSTVRPTRSLSKTFKAKCFMSIKLRADCTTCAVRNWSARTSLIWYRPSNMTPYSAILRTWLMARLNTRKDSA